MKFRKIILLLILVSIIVIMLNHYSETVTADDSKLDFSKDPTYELIKAEDNKYYYNVYVSVKNTAEVSSSPIDIRIYEDDRKSSTNTDTCLGVIFGPNEEKDFTIEWSTPYKQRQIEIKYTPSNPDNNTKFNQGSTTLDVIYEPANQNGTPGFSLMIFFISIIVLSYFKKIKDK